jgi:glycosyltransferase involved in cell wall biosynthesis
MTNSKSISIIIAAYNAAKTIDRCLQSLLNQVKVNDYKIIVVNDGSTDNTLEHLSKYKLDSSIYILDKENTGASDSRNHGLKLVDTDFVTFVDADDYVDNDYLYTMLKQYEDNINCDLAICGYQKENVDGSLIMLCEGKKTILNQQQAYHDLFISYNFEGYLVNKLFKVDIIKDNNLCIDEDVTLSEDLLFCCQYLKYCQQIYFDPKPVYHYIRYEDSQLHSHQIGAPFDKSALGILDTFSKIKEEIPKGYDDVNINVNARICWFAVTLLRSIYAAPNWKDVNKETIIFLRKVARKHRKDFMKNDVLPSRDKLIYWINWLFPKLFARMWNTLGLRDHS